MIDEQVIFKEAKLTIKKRLILQWLLHCKGQWQWLINWWNGNLLSVKSRQTVLSNKLISILKQKDYLHKGQVSELIVGKCITLHICQFKIVGKNSLEEKAGIEYKLICLY